MIDKSEVIRFFDKYAAGWDADMKKDDRIIGIILDNAGVFEGTAVLDVACGTGVLFPDYLARGAASVTAIDISPEMAKIASEKAALMSGELVRGGGKPKIDVICADAEEYDFGRRFDSVVIYNAFPHFGNPALLIERLAFWVKPGGRLSVAHGMSRSTLTRHHGGSASKVSVLLLEADELAAVFSPHFDVDVIISNDEMYQVAGRRRE